MVKLVYVRFGFDHVSLGYDRIGYSYTSRTLGIAQSVMCLDTR